MLTEFVKKVCENFNSIAAKQEAKGVEKYGQGVDPHDKKNYDWIGMAEEEFVDGLNYLYAEKVRRNEIISEAVKRIEELSNGLDLYPEQSKRSEEAQLIADSLSVLYTGRT